MVRLMAWHRQMQNKDMKLQLILLLQDNKLEKELELVGKIYLLEWLCFICDRI